MDSWESSDGALIIDGEDVRRHKPSAVIRDAFTQQVQGTWSRWMKKRDKILLMDNASTAFHPQFIAYVEGRFERILYTMTEEEYLAQLKVNGDVAKYRSLRIAPLTHGQQEKLIHNWLDMQIVKRKDSEKYQEIDDLEDHINAIVDRNRIVPRYPFFVLSILQTREAFMPQDFQITAYAHCYQALIVAHLCRSGLQSTELDSAMNLLTELAYKISQDRRNGIRTQRRVFVEEYGQTFVFDERILENIEESGGLLRHDRDGNVQFGYNFVYYFFLGKALAERYEENKSNISTLAETNYRTDSAHTLLFLLHHSRSQDLLETILLHTMETLEDTPAASLTAKETSTLARALESIPKSLPPMSTSDARTEQRDRRDTADERELRKAEEEDKVSSSKVYRALRNMDILAQVLRNQYGSMTKERLKEVVGAVIDVGLQLIYMFTNEELLANEEKHIRKEVEERYNRKKSERGRLDADRITRDVSRQLRILSIVVIAVLVDKTVLSIWRRELAPIVSDVCKESGDPAHKLVTTLFEITTRRQITDRDSELVEKLNKELKRDRNYVVARILSLMIQEHLRTHYVPPPVRQKLFQTLGISYEPSLPKRQR